MEPPPYATSPIRNPSTASHQQNPWPKAVLYLPHQPDNHQSEEILHNLDFASNAKGPTSSPPLPTNHNREEDLFFAGSFQPQFSIVAHFYWNRKLKVDQTFPAWIEVESRSLRGASLRLAGVTLNCSRAISCILANWLFVEFVYFMWNFVYWFMKIFKNLYLTCDSFCVKAKLQAKIRTLKKYFRAMNKSKYYERI